MTIDISTFYIFVVLFAINLIAFLTMMIDKMKSRNPRASRVPEIVLFFMALVFGALGIYAGMFAFRHKTLNWSFKIGIPLLLILNISNLYFLYPLINLIN